MRNISLYVPMGASENEWEMSRIPSTKIANFIFACYLSQKVIRRHESTILSQQSTNIININMCYHHWLNCVNTFIIFVGRGYFDTIHRKWRMFFLYNLNIVLPCPNVCRSVKNKCHRFFIYKIYKTKTQYIHIYVN